MMCLQSWCGSACVMSTRTEPRQDFPNVVRVPKVQIYLKSSQHEGNFQSKRNPKKVSFMPCFPYPRETARRLPLGSRLGFYAVAKRKVLVPASIEPLFPCP